MKSILFYCACVVCVMALICSAKEPADQESHLLKHGMMSTQENTEDTKKQAEGEPPAEIYHVFVVNEDKIYYVLREMHQVEERTEKQRRKMLPQVDKALTNAEKIGLEYPNSKWCKMVWKLINIFKYINYLHEQQGYDYWPESVNLYTHCYKTSQKWMAVSPHNPEADGDILYLIFNLCKSLRPMMDLSSELKQDVQKNNKEWLEAMLHGNEQYLTTFSEELEAKYQADIRNWEEFFKSDRYPFQSTTSSGKEIHYIGHSLSAIEDEQLREEYISKYKAYSNARKQLPEIQSRRRCYPEKEIISAIEVLYTANPFGIEELQALIKKHHLQEDMQQKALQAIHESENKKNTKEPPKKKNTSKHSKKAKKKAKKAKEDLDE